MSSQHPPPIFPHTFTLHPPPIFPPDQMLIPGDAAATPLCMLGEQMLLL